MASNPYDLLLDGEQQRQRAMLAGSLSTAVDINPDAFSAQRRVAKYLGYPTAAVEALPKETKTQAAVKQVTDATANSPALQNKYLEPDFARLAHDDAPKLTEIEQAVRQYGELKAWKGPEPTTGSVLTGLAQSLPQGLRAMREGLRQQMGDLFDTLGILPRTEQEKAEQLRRAAQAQGASAYTTPEFESSTAGAVYGGLTSVLRQAPGIALSVATGNPVPALASIGVQTQAEAYGKYRVRGATPGMAAVGGLAEGAVEVGTELLPMGFLVNKLGKTGMTEFFTGMLARELPTEQVATLLQDAIDTAIANPDKTWQQYLNERPEAAYQTLVATITQSAVMAGAGAAARRAMRDTNRVNDAEGDAQRLTELFAKAGESKLRERDPSTFAELVQGVADQTDGAPKSVFIDAATLAEALKSPEAAEVFNQMPQAVQDQLPEALAGGGTVELPIGDLVAHASGTPLEKVLLQNLRTAPDSLSQLEAQEAAGQAESYLQAEATRVIEEATNADAMRTSSEVVKANVLGQLNKTMRFRPEVNESYASLAGAFYTTMAGRLGITPEEMFAKYPLRITAEQPGGGVLNDSGLRPGEMNVEGYHFSMADRPTLSTGYFGTGLKGSAREDIQNAKVEDTVFAEQKTGLMPEWTWTEGVVPDEGAPAADLAQGEHAPRATFSPSQLEITLLENADLSSFLHEMGHFFLEVQADLASQPDAPQQIKDDLAATLKWFGVKADKKTGQTPEQVWAGLDLEGKRAYHERWAESFEQYLFEGKAPSVEMRGVFQRFRQFMISAYKSLKAFMQGRNLRLSDEVRGVFDRLIATDEQIAEAQSLANFEAVFKSAKEAGMTPEEWAAYQEQNAAATTDATEDLQKKSLAGMKWAAAARGKALRAAQADVKEKRDAMRAEVKAEVEALPVEQARAYIKDLRTSTPEQRDALKDWGDRREAAQERAREEVKAAFMATPEAQAVKGIKKGQLLAKNKKALDNQAEAKVIAWEQENPRPTPVLPEPQMDTIAEQFGFTSGDELARTLAEQPPAAQFIDALTEQRLLETYGEVVTADGMARAANEAVHNEARRRFVATELAAMQRAMSATAPTGKTTAKGRPLSVNVIVQAAKSFAETVVNRRKILDLKPAQHAAAATRAAAKALKLQAEGKTADAIAAKRDQLLSEYTARYTAQAAAEVKRSIEYLKKFDKASVREKLPADYLDQIDQMLERFDLRTSTTAREIDRRASLASWVAKQQEMGLDPVVPQDLLDNARLTSYKEMTVEEFRGLVDGVKSVEHLARLKSKLLAAKDKREFDAIVAEAVDSIREHGGKPRPVQLEPDGRIKKFFKGAWADHRKFNSLIRQMDGGQDNGPMYRILVRSMNDAGASEATRLEQATEALAKIYAPIEKLPGGFSGAKVFIPEIRNSLSRAGRLSIALNWGNPQNRQRVMDGDGWTEAQVNAILATLTPVELKFVNDVWAHIDTYWADIKAKQERVTGVAEDKVEAVPFELNGVQMRGGYYPIKYDTERSIKAEKQEALETAKQIMQGMVARPTTRRGHTKARVEEVKGRPVRKDLSVITQHVNQVVHDLAWHEWFIDANRILNDPRVAVAIREYHGNETARTLKETADAIAVGDAVHQGQIDRLLLLMRSNVSRSIMGASLTTALMQPFGLTQSMARVGVVPVLKGAARWAGDSVRMESTVGWINEKSEFMRLRSKTFNRELREISQRVQGKSKIAQVYDTSLFMLMQKLQLVADVPTWVGAYEKALAGGVDESAAVSLADEAVLGSQGGGTTKDLSAVQRNMPFLTQFYSYFNTTLNLVAEKTATTEFKDPKAVAGWMADMALLTVIPAILPALLTFLLKGGGEDDDAEKWAKRVLEWQAGYLFGMFVGLRELPTLWSPFDYAGPPAGKIVGDGKKAVSQAGQGEIDEPAVLATINLLGTAFGIPTIQATRSYKGWKAWSEGDAPATAILFGPPPRD
jgi:hypothetical protein